MRHVLRVVSQVTPILLTSLFVSVDFALANLRYGEKVVTVVAAERVNLRALPESRPETILSQVAAGAQLRLLDRAADWFKVGLPDGQTAWLSAIYGREDVARDLVRVKVPAARIRESNGVDSPIVSKVEEGTFLHPLEVEEGWVKVRLPDDMAGWIRGDLVSVCRVSRDEASEESSTHTLLLLASVGSGVSALSFVIVLTTVFRRKQRNASAGYY